MPRRPPTSPLFPYTTLFRSIPAAAFPADFPSELPAGQEIFGRGGAAIIDPEWGDVLAGPLYDEEGDRKSTRLNSSHPSISYAVFCLKKKTTTANVSQVPCAT